MALKRYEWFTRLSKKNSFELDVETISKDTIYEIADFLRNEHLLLDRFPFISAQKYNDSIKEIFRLCGITRIVTVLNSATGNEEKRPINEVVSSNMARRTFAGNLYKRVKDHNLIASMTGHKPGSTAFARYIDIDMDIKTEMIDLLNE